MPFIDKLISAVIIGAFLLFVGSKVYSHEKEHLDPIIKKIKGWLGLLKGWLIPNEEDLTLNPSEDYELGFRGQMR